MTKAIIHIDGDAFFASCEVALDPSLRGKPVITGAERGIATSLTYEAKALGISRGMPVYLIRKNFPEVVVRHSDFHLYSIFADRMYKIVGNYTPLVEAYSIDECFADITNHNHKLSYEDIARAIKSDLYTKLGMTFSVGLGPTKVLAKVASKWQKPNGLTIINKDCIENFLREMPVGQIWGIGPQTSRLLIGLGVKTALEFVNRPENWVKENLSRPYLEIWYELKGKPIHKVHDEPEDDYKSVQKTRTFTPPSKDKNFLFSELSKNVEGACQKIRRYGLETRKIHYFLKTQEFRYQRLEVTLNTPTDTPNSVLKAIRETLDKVYRPNTSYRATGVTLSGLIDNRLSQKDLFGQFKESRAWADVYKSVDKIDRRYGSHTVMLASSLKSLRGRGEKISRRLKIPYMGEVT